MKLILHGEGLVRAESVRLNLKKSSQESTIDLLHYLLYNHHSDKKK